METGHERPNGEMVRDVVKGAIAGAVGVWAMDQVTWWMWSRASAEQLQQERDARPGGVDPAHVIAERAAEAVGTELNPKQPHAAGIAVHYGLGVGPGAAYAPLRRRFSGLAAGGGLLYGLGLFVINDELANPLLRLSGGPSEYPWEAHARGLVGHLVLGAVTHATLSVLDQVA